MMHCGLRTNWSTDLYNVKANLMKHSDIVSAQDEVARITKISQKIDFRWMKETELFFWNRHIVSQFLHNIEELAKRKREWRRRISQKSFAKQCFDSYSATLAIFRIKRSKIIYYINYATIWFSISLHCGVDYLALARPQASCT